MSFNELTGWHVCDRLLNTPLPEQVLNQTISFYPRHWAQKWPDELSSHRPNVLNETGKVSRSRKELFKLGEKTDDVTELLEFYVNVCGWGCGTKARSAARTMKPVIHDPITFRDNLHQGIAILRSSNAIEAYDFFSTSHQIKFLGPAFFTKLLYFADPKREALILDARVARSLGAAKTNDWTTEEYKAYLATVDAIRNRLDSNLTNDCIEYLLFKG